MKNKYLYNLITSLLIISTILTPFSLLPQKAEAQAQSLKMVSISALPQCKEVDKGTKALFRGTIGVLSAKIQGTDNKTAIESGAISAVSGYVIDSITGSIEQEAQKAVDDLNSVQVRLGETERADIKATRTAAEDTKKSTSSISDNNCLAAIGRILTKMLIKKLTLSTVNWINGGFNGSPSFIQDYSKFFKDLAKSEILQFNDQIMASGSPFAKEWIKNTVRAFNSKFQDNAAYSLDKLIKNTTPQYSSLSFGVDFSQGGWNAWNAITQAPANNPLGFQLIADNELQKRLDGTVQSTADQVHEALSQADGFLGDQRCVNPEGVTKQEDENARIERSNHPEQFLTPEDLTKMAESTEPPYQYKYRICNNWQYVTPGNLIARAATQTIETSQDSLFAVQDLNDAIEAITNALLAKFSSTLMEKGFAALDASELGSDPIVIDGVTNDNGSNRSRVEEDFNPSQLSSSWLSDNPDFNIRTDLTQALIDEQRTYSDKLALQNKELLSTTDGKPYALSTDGKSSNAYGLIPVINQLDYCIPGPHPGWENDTQTNLTNMFSNSPASISSGDSSSFVDTVINSIPFVGGLIGALFADDAGEQTFEARNQYADIFFNITSFRPRVRKSLDNLEILDSRLTSKDGMIYIISQTLNRYTQIMNKTYFSPNMLPPISKEAELSYNQIEGYKQIIKENEDKINSLKTTVNILGDIKKAVAGLNLKYPNKGNTYEDELKTQINAFGRISVHMVNGTDIASADNLMKQIIDKKNYLYKDLLKGTYGCEAFLEKLDKTPNDIKNFPAAPPGVPGKGIDWNNFNVNTVKRMPYPAQILYDYNSFPTAGDLLPDPLNKPEIYKNKTPKNDWTTYGPGFLSFVYFTNANSSETSGSERLNIGDLVDTYGHETHPFLMVPLSRFEYVMGIY